MSDKISKMTKLLLDCMYYGGFAVIFTLPITIRIYSRFNPYFKTYYWQLCVLFFVSGIFAIFIIGELRKMMKTVLNNDCFVRENVLSLHKMAGCSIGITVTTCCRLLLYITPAVLIVILVFLIAGLFSKVLAGVFDKAVTYKLENDLTI